MTNASKPWRKSVGSLRRRTRRTAPQRRRNDASRRTGSSLPEVMISMLILALGVTAVIALFPVGARNVANAVNDTQTGMLAQNASAISWLTDLPNDPSLISMYAYDEANPDTFCLLDGNARAAEFGTGTGMNHKVNTSLSRDNRENEFSRHLDLPITFGDKGIPPLDRTLPGRKLPYHQVNAYSSPPSGEWGTVTGPKSPSGIDNCPIAAAPGTLWSFPVLIDPFAVLEYPNWYESVSPKVSLATPQQFESNPCGRTQPRIPITNYYRNIVGMSGRPPYFDIGVYTPRAVTLLEQQFGGGSDNAKTTRYQTQAAVGYRWFSSLNDIIYSSRNPVSPANQFGENGFPSVTNYTNTWFGDNSATSINGVDSTTWTTCQRQIIYTWAVMIQRALDPDPTQGEPNWSDSSKMVDPVIPRPGRNSNVANTRLAYLCFARRNPSRPYQVVEGCIFFRSRRVTLAWPITAERPNVKKGTWLCEASITGNKVTGAYNLAKPTDISYHRQWFAFHQVSEVREPRLMPAGTMDNTVDYLAMDVIVDKTPQEQGDYLRAHSLVDYRLPDTYRKPLWPYFFPGSGSSRARNGTYHLSTGDWVGSGESSPLKNNSDKRPIEIWMPIVIFDGLVEVFEEYY